MDKHIIIWNFKEEFTTEQNRENALKVKSGLEGLKGRIDGLLEMNIHIDNLRSSTGDVMLESLFTDEKALNAYTVNPEHVKVAEFVRSVLTGRKCVDFEIE